VSQRPALVGLGAKRLAKGEERIIVTGAGGWIGMATLELLSELLGEAFDERVVGFGASERPLHLRGGRSLTQRPLEALAHLPAAPSIVLHLAFLAQEKATMMSAGAYTATNWAISLRVLSALELVGAKALFLASSGAVHLSEDSRAPESERLYGRMKLEDEERFGGWAQEAGAWLAIGRVFNLSGPYMNKRSGYALGSFIADAQAGRPIAITSARRVYRSYVSVEALMSVVLGVLTEPKPTIELFDTAGESAPELAGLANTVIDVLNPRLGVRRPELTPDAPDRYVGDGARFAALCERYHVPRLTLAEQVRHTADYMAKFPEPPAG
jgi:nucleoside-diphosphate-sugar epimerase